MSSPEVPDFPPEDLLDAAPKPPKKPPVVLLHGAGLLPTMWQSQVEALGADRRALAPWIAGLRPGRRFDLSLKTAAAELINTLDLSGYQTVDVVAHQLGAMVALQAAADYPDRIGRLVVSGAMLLPGRMALRLQKAALRMLPVRGLENTGLTKDDLVKALDVMAEADFSSKLGEITARTLVIVGQSDTNGQVSAKALASQLPNGRLETISAAAQPPLENPEAFNRAMVQFLD
ncbi:MAG: alpha/beta hydrolase [Propionicimonas sp.]